MTTLLQNPSNLDAIIEELKRPREDEELNINEILKRRAEVLGIMLEVGWPFQDVIYDNDQPNGVPIVLASIVIEVCRFCADHNIDLSDAIGLTFNR